MWIIFLLLLVMIQNCLGIIYKLNATEFYRMPPLYKVDSFDRCLSKPGGVYCSVKLAVVSDTPNELLTMMEEYSQYKKSHFNHTSLLYGICMSETCKHISEKDNDVYSKENIERCMNESLWKDYRLKTKVIDEPECRPGDDAALEGADIAVAGICLTIVIMSVIGSIYDFFFTLRNGKKGNRFLLCFSLKRNWRTLTQREIVEESRTCLRCFHGLRVITSTLAIMSHAFLVIIVLADSIQYIESMYDNIYWHLFYEGPLAVQTSFLISGCLLAYSLKVYEEKNVLTWKTVFRELLLKWLGLTPVYAVMLSITSTWQRFTGHGPFWPTFIGAEVEDCRRDGWLNILYSNNYIDNSQCMPQTWYLAVDMQLTVVGLLVLVFTKNKVRYTVLAVLFAAGITMPALHTYYQNLDATLLVAPETARNFFVKDPTFNTVYKRSHTNLATYVLGILFGHLIYYWQNNPPTPEQIKKYRIVYYLSYPGVLATVLYRSLLFVDGPPAPLVARVLYLALAKPFFSIIIMLIATGMMFLFKSPVRAALEWRGWSAPARVSYCADMVHVFFIRNIGGTGALLKNASVMHFLETSLGILAISYIVAVPYWLLVEAPAAALLLRRAATAPHTAEDEQPDTTKADIQVHCNGIITVKL